MSINYLVINPGSTSTKLALFTEETLIHDYTLRHDELELSAFASIPEQKEFRKHLILAFLKEHNVSFDSIDCFVGRGGLLHPLTGGTYAVNDKMLHDLTLETFGSHASNLGAILAYELSKINNKPAFIVDPVCVDELDDIARVSGLKGLERISIFHALNQKAIARKHSEVIGLPYNQTRLIVAHLGGGISVGYHRNGRVVDVNNALNGDGPFSPERTGGLPVISIIDLCLSNRYTRGELLKMINGKGGLMSYLGTSSGLKIMERIKNNDQEARLYYDAMIYQIVKEIGALYFAAKGEVDSIVITGGLAYSPYLVEQISTYIKGIAPVHFYPGEDEMSALMLGASRVLNGDEEAKLYE